MAVSLPSISLSDEAAQMLTEAFVSMGYSGTLEEASENFMLGQFKSMIMSNLSTQVQNTHQQAADAETQALIPMINAAFAS